MSAPRLTPEPPRARQPRADAVRNRERLLEAAKGVFSAGGPNASLEGVAREAGVGIGTLYRHFPTREALFEAVYRREVDQMAAYAIALSRDEDAVEALRRWLHRAVDMIATKKGMITALALAVDSGCEVYQYSFQNLARSVQLLLDAAVQAGRIRSDVGADDVLRALIGMSYPDTRDGWREQAVKLLDILVDGLLIR
jgi:AcrR family transcriptional regulator